MAGRSAEERLHELLGALGGPDFRRLAEPFERFGQRACDIMLGIVAGDRQVQPFGVPKANPRAVWEDFAEVVGLTARHWPARFVEVVAADPRLRASVPVVWALGRVDSTGATDVLLEAVRVRTAGHEFLRWAALTSLERLASPALAEELPALVRDRANLVQSSAVSAAIGFGSSGLIPQLHRIALADRTAPGTRDDAWDAIEAIRSREHLADGPLGPHGPRLVPLYPPSTGEPSTVVSVAPQLSGHHVWVGAGQELVVLTSGPVHAPVTGLVVSVLAVPGRQTPPALLWIRTAPTAVPGTS